MALSHLASHRLSSAEILRQQAPPETSANAQPPPPPTTTTTNADLENLSRDQLILELKRARDRINELSSSLEQKEEKLYSAKEEIRASKKRASGLRARLSLLRGDSEDADEQCRAAAHAAERADITSEQFADPATSFTEFTEASPFFWRALDAHQKRVNAIGKRLKSIERLGSQFCEVGSSYASISNSLAMEMCADWRQIEPSSSALHESLSMGANFRKLGEVLKEVQVFQDILMFSIENTFLVRVREFRSRFIQAAKDSRKALFKAAEDYETTLVRTLSLPTSRKAYLVRKAMIFSRTDEEEKLAELKRKFELQRFDHVRLLNEIVSVRKLELLEGICACHYAFLAFFHSGHELSRSMDPFAKKIQVLLAKKTKFYTEGQRELLQNRRQLERRYASCASVGMSSLTSSPASSVCEGVGEASSSASLAEADLRRRASRNAKSVVTKQGYLFKQSSNLKRDWKRRWFVLEDGAMYYFRPAKDSNSELEPEFVVNILICTVRAIDKQELPHCFEIISPNRRVYTLQAENAQDRLDWIDVINNCTEYMLSVQSSGANSLDKTQRTFSVEQHCRQAISEQKNMLKLLNKTCADCSQPDPDWAAINHGICICIECSGIHRSLGVHISKVRSLSLDEWSSTLLELMLALGNDRFNAVFEGAPDLNSPKPAPDAERAAKERYVLDKYVKRMHCVRAPNSAALSFTTDLVVASSKGAIELMLRALVFGAGVTESVNGGSALHAAAAANQDVAVEYLLQNGAQPQLTDSEGRTALEVAIECGSTQVIALLSPLASNTPIH